MSLEGIEAMLSATTSIALVEVEVLARRVLRSHDHLDQFVMAMGEARFPAASHRHAHEVHSNRPSRHRLVAAPPSRNTREREGPMATPSNAHPSTTLTADEMNLLASDGSYEVVVLDRNNRISRVIYRNVHYAAALGYLSKNHAKRAWLDLTRNGQFVPWELEPAPVGTPLVTFVLTDADLADGMVAA